MQQIENFLTKEQHNKILEITTSDYFSWYYGNSVIRTDVNKDDFMFSHVFYTDDKINSDYYNDCILPIMNKLSHKQIIRAKANCYTKREKQFKHGFHIDNEEPHIVALYCINDNNGYTEFENGKIYNSIANSLIIFNGNIQHRSVNQTDTKQRLNININYIQ